MFHLIETLTTSSDAIAAQDLNNLMLEIKSKFQVATSHFKKVQILTCKQISWSIDQWQNFFQCEVYIVCQVIALKTEQGVLAKPTRLSR